MTDQNFSGAAAGPLPEDNQAVLRRWRLVLGRYSERALASEAPYGKQDLLLEQTLDYLYGREYAERGLARGASLDQSQVHAIDWLNRTRKLFPREVYQRLQSQALERYGMTGLLDDPQLLDSMEPSQSLVKTLLSLRGRMGSTTRDAVRRVIAKTVEEIMQRLQAGVCNAIVGRRNRFRSSTLRSAQNFDWRATIRSNLKHYDQTRQQLVIERPRFNARVKNNLPWDVILCVDQSGSMTDSILYAAVLAGILAGLPAVRIRLVVFDTQVVDLTHLAHDPVEVLLTVQLGGGTDIGRAVQYCETLVSQPGRTIFALISDFCEGAPVSRLLASVRRMAGSRVTLLGLAALDDEASPVYDQAMARRLAACGMEVAALTPQHFAEWLGDIMQGAAK